jgi:hypothetical protein
MVVVALPGSAQARFDVTSVKPHPDATAQDARFNGGPDRLEVTAGTVGDVLDMLNGFQLDHVTGGRASLDENRSIRHRWES